ADVPLEGALEGADIAKPRGEGDPGDRVVMGAHQLHATLHAKDSDPFGERQADLRMEEGGEVFPFQAGDFGRGVEGDRLRYVGVDELENRRQAVVVRERFGMEALSESRNPQQTRHHFVNCGAAVKRESSRYRRARWARSPGTTSPRSTSASAGSSRPRTSPRRGSPHTNCGSISESSA